MNGKKQPGERTTGKNSSDDRGSGRTSGPESHRPKRTTSPDTRRSKRTISPDDRSPGRTPGPDTRRPKRTPAPDSRRPKRTTSPDREIEMIATTLFGLEDILAGELRSAGAGSVKKLNRAVSFSGDRELLYRVNITSRTASRILVPVRQRQIRNEKELYSAARDIDWKKYIGRKATFAIDSVVHSKHFNHSQFVALRVKDAIADQFRDKFGTRPDVNREDPDVRINVHIDRERLTISLDSSGTPLHRRGYRLEGGGAPLGESLAAGMVMLSGYDGSGAFVDPMCGSGTILIEAALISANISPGLLREKFGYFGWKDFDRKLHEKTIAAARKKIRRSTGIVSGCDITARAVKSARANIERAGLAEAIEVRKTPFAHFTPPEGPGIMITNPPYGERMGRDDIIEFYKSIGDMLKKSYQGYEAWVISSNREALKFIGLRPSQKIVLFNGPLECRFQRYSIYSGSKKAKYNDQVSAEKDGASTRPQGRLKNGKKDKSENGGHDG